MRNSKTPLYFTSLPAKIDRRQEDISSMHRPYQLRRRRLPPSVDETTEQHVENTQYSHKTLRLGIVHPGRYVPWCSLEVQGEEPLWVLSAEPRRMDLSGGGKSNDHASETNIDGSARSLDRIASLGTIRERDSNDSTELVTERRDSVDDPNSFILQMKKDLDLQRQMLRLLMLAHKTAREDWAKTPFKLMGLEGRGEAGVLKLLFLVADQPLEDERITAEQAEDLKSQTPYGEFPTIAKCGITFGDASAISMALATKFQLFGETVQEQLVVGATYSRLRCLQEKHKRTLAWVMCGQVKDKAKIEWAQGQLLHVILPPAIKEWDQQIRSTKGPFLVESGMTLADIAIMDFLDQCSSHLMIDGLLADYLAVSDMTEAVRSCPRLLAHLQDREED
ncbi:glutathione S-transferase [Elysia marginata]|uniref:Glutathione S-transferase n=1 Tax=Elysia marginata TaxID=1093978 RepID=A0AAV4JBK4_9GAST|nr:glutathione S-transferase [Elysia marginata]